MIKINLSEKKVHSAIKYSQADLVKLACQEKLTWYEICLPNSSREQQLALIEAIDQINQ